MPDESVFLTYAADRDPAVMPCVCLSLLAGAYALHFSSFEDHSDQLIVLLFAVFIAYRIGGRSAAAAFTIGIALFARASVSQIDERLDPAFEGDSMLSVIRVTDFPARTGKSASFTGSPVEDRRVPPRIRLSWHDPEVMPRFGEVWQLEIRLRRPRATSNPGVFDFETWLFRERIGATGYVVAGKRNRKLRAPSAGAIDERRKRFVDRLFRVVPEPPAAAVLAAISVGARHGIAQRQWDRYARSGTSHLMAISGLHVALAAASAFWIALLATGLARISGNHRSLALCMSVISALAYAALSGFAVPAQRAVLMLCLLIPAMVRHREPAPFAVLALAACVVVVNDPFATLMPGFKLSFAAVLLLLWLARARNPGARRGLAGRILEWLAALLRMQVFLLLGMLPLTALLFLRVAAVAPLVNVVAVPLFSLVTVPMVLAGMLMTGPAEPLGDLAIRLSAASVSVLEKIIDLALLLPYSTVQTAIVAGVAALYAGLVGAWVLLPRGWPGRWLAWLAALAVVTQSVDPPPAACVDIRVLDVGQGLGVVVRTPTRTLLYDTGPAFRSGGSMAERVVVPYLSGQGIRRIDRLIASHADADHAGGLDDILDRIVVGNIVAGEPLDDTAATACVAGHAWNWDGIDFRVLHPPAGSGLAGNDASCVLQVSAGDTALLLTGDIERRSEQRLLTSGYLNPVDVALIPHHGSKTSSSESFVRALVPGIAIASAGYGNRWDFPRPEVVTRWRHAGARVLSTSTAGAIGIRLCDGSGVVSVVRDREARRRIWHEQPGAPLRSAP